MHIEDVARIGFAAGRLACQQSNLAMRGGVFGEIVDHDQPMLPAIAEILRHREAGERRDPLQARRTRRSRHYDDTALGPALGPDRLDGAPHAGCLLPDGDIDTDDIAILLVDDCVIATVVLPMARSPMMSSRWPRPSANSVSTTTMPVCTGWVTRSRSIVAGAGRST